MAEPGWNSEANVCKEWGQGCCGDPYRYPPTDQLYAGGEFFEHGRRERIAFFDTGLNVDEGGARISGHLWAPEDAEPGDDLPCIVITNGGLATETMYWWFAQTAAAKGYVVLTYDARGLGRSDTFTPEGTPGFRLEDRVANDTVFVTNQVDAIDFMQSTPENPYPGNVDRSDAPDVFREYNPLHDIVDTSRIGIAGHSHGSTAVSIVQGLGSRPDESWPGRLSDENPIDAAVAWDNLDPAGPVGSEFEWNGVGYDIVPNVPAMGQSADYRLEPQPKREPPDPERKSGGFKSWREAGVSSFQFNIRGGTHYEWSLVPGFPATDWDAWGNEMADFATLAWLDRWMKQPGEPGYGTATDRLTSLASEPWEERLSFYYRSAFDFVGRGPGNSRQRRRCLDMKGGCSNREKGSTTAPRNDGDQ